MTGGPRQTASAAPGPSRSGAIRLRAAVALFHGLFQILGVQILGVAVPLLTGSPAQGDEFRTPTIAAVDPDWRAAHAQLRSELGSRPELTGLLTFTGAGGHAPDDPRRWPAFAQLAALTSPLFPAIGRSTVPVLLPLDTATLLADRAGGAPQLAPAHYQAGFDTEMFDAGPAGYDALFSLPPTGIDGSPQRSFAEPVEVHITGSLLIYDINDPLAGKGKPVKMVGAPSPDLRRVIREGFVRYAFTRFGVPYVVSIPCLDSVPRRHRLACREASAVAERFLAALRIAGGRPQRRHGNIESVAVERPAAVSASFTYRPPGAILPNSGYQGQPGRPDLTAYAQIRFPLRDVPAFANSQSFLNWGDCNFTGRTASPHSKGAPYRCRRNDKPLVFDESAAENYSYPWQDNFCESRHFEVGQCANGFGHQGQDIRPSACPLRNDGADRCEPGRFPILAARDGVILRSPKQQAAYLLVDAARDHVRLRYMHMAPAQMDADGLLSGRLVAEGETIGFVSNYQDYPGGTTSHLHFDLQVFTPDGWLWVNPYVTLVAAYERLLAARGTEVPPEPPPEGATAGALTPEPAKTDTSTDADER